MTQHVPKTSLLIRSITGLGLIAMAGLFAGCSATEDEASESATVTQTSTTTGEVTSTESVTEQTEPATKTVVEPPETNAQSCEDTQLPIKERGVAALTDSEAFYHFNIDEDAFDSCAPISWVTLQGSLGTEDQPGATAGSSAQTVIFFHYGDLIAQDPALVPQVDAVTATSNTVVAASYWVDNGPRAAGDQDLRTSWYQIGSAGVVVTDDSLADRSEIQHLDLAGLQ